MTNLLNLILHKISFYANNTVIAQCAWIKKWKSTLIKPMKFVSFYANHTVIAQCQWIKKMKVHTNKTHEIRLF